MDLENVWQEHKTFISTVVGVLVAFFIASALIANGPGDDLRLAESTLLSENGRLRAKLHNADDRKAARAAHDGLEAALESLAGRGVFMTRPEFELSSAGSSPANQYLRITEQVSQSLLPDAARMNVDLPVDMGLPQTSPTSPGDIARTLRALDLVERAARIAIGARVDAVERIRMTPVQVGRRGRTTKVSVTSSFLDEIPVTFDVRGRPEAVLRFIEGCLDAGLVMGEAEVNEHRRQKGKRLAQVTLLALRVREEAGR